MFIANKKLEDKQVPPPLPYSLLKLQADCSEILGINMQDTLDITQDLRIKYELITYNRSTCEYLSEEQYLEPPSVINAIQSNLSSFNQLKPNSSIKSRAFNDSNVDAHHAIIPTEITMDLSKLSEKERT